LCDKASQADVFGTEMTQAQEGEKPKRMRKGGRDGNHPLPLHDSA